MNYQEKRMKKLRKKYKRHEIKTFDDMMYITEDFCSWITLFLEKEKG